jgi:glutamate synthase (NADPH/NADH) large chain/glutamate synthase (ferredoxin)
MSNHQRPTAAGLYDPSFEHDACGIGAVARLDNRREHEIIERALDVLFRLEHRGAVGSEVDTGDGAGILFQVPDEFFRAVVDFELPDPSRYGVGMCFATSDPAKRAEAEALAEKVIADEGQTLLGWRDVPVDENVPGPSAAEVMPVVRQLFIGSTLPDDADELAFERKLYVIRRVIEAQTGVDLIFCSLSCRTIVYKGMLTSPQVPAFYPDLNDARVKSSVALVHSRFSTNTFPSWELAHPYRLICHNGEINTVKGNVNWMRARESELASELFGDDMQKILPVVSPGARTQPRSTTCSSC